MACSITFSALSSPQQTNWVVFRARHSKPTWKNVDCLVKKVALDHTAKTTADGKLLRTFAYLKSSVCPFDSFVDCLLFSHPFLFLGQRNEPFHPRAPTIPPAIQHVEFGQKAIESSRIGGSGHTAKTWDTDSQQVPMADRWLGVSGPLLQFVC